MNGANDGFVGEYMVDDVALYSFVVGSQVVLVGPDFYDVFICMDRGCSVTT